ncbi:hypothetical protein WKI68_07605 [Streptomyces sp. MS1.HAVA.3]|uniref:Tetracyclin repressor-like C-terminal domain-containing protein n=1 Tax=Streptomyces caledonius TaxID=3134107 RepID=A0ABU8U0K0_9ACTN
MEGRVRTHLRDAQDPVAGIRSFFTSAFDTDPGPEPDPGCLLTNTAVESFTVPQATPGVRRGLETIESGFADALTRACTRAQRLLPPELDVERSATQLLALYQGLLVLVRSGTGAAKLHTITDGALASIGAGQARTVKRPLPQAGRRTRRPWRRSDAYAGPASSAHHVTT